VPPLTLLAQTEAPTPLPQTATPRFHLAFNHRPRERNDKVRIIIAQHQTMRAEIRDLVARRLKPCEQFLFQTKSTVVSCNSYAHSRKFILLPDRSGLDVPANSRRDSLGFGRSPAFWLVFENRCIRLERWVNNSPRFFDVIFAGEQRGVPGPSRHRALVVSVHFLGGWMVCRQQFR